MTHGTPKTSLSAEHWQRPVRDGGIEFYFRAPDGQTMKGSVVPASDYSDLRDAFEEWTGCILPDPEIKPPR